MGRYLRVFMFTDGRHPYIKMLVENLKSLLPVKVYHFKRSPRAEFIGRFQDILSSDIIHFHWINYLVRSRSFFITWFLIIFWLLTVYFFKFIGKRIILTLHDIHPRDQLYSYPVYFFFARFLRLCDLIIAHNNFTVMFAKPYYRLKNAKFTVIPHGDFYEYYSNIKPKRVEINLPNLDSLKILFIGNIRGYKGLEKLVQIIEDLSGNLDVSFIVAGRCMDKEMCSKLRDLSRRASNFQFIPKFLEDGEIRFLVEFCDVGLIPYRTTTTPGSMLLFLSHGKPVIVPKKPPLTEYCREAKACFLYDDEQWMKDIMNILKKLAEHRDILNKLSNNASSYSKRFRWRSIAFCTLEGYLRVLKS